ncbi:MAG TPA: hypothetical protein VHW67_11635 [Solirubrobacteraceae bacterium]|nr:hypothetical protein [Solirubrobacteraceae bacterium]
MLAPSPLAADVEVELPLELLEDDELLLPHAAKPTLSAAIADSIVTLDPAFLNLLHRVPGIYASSCC